jgi:hypothetical protein
LSGALRGFLHNIFCSTNRKKEKKKERKKEREKEKERKRERERKKERTLEIVIKDMILEGAIRMDIGLLLTDTLVSSLHGYYKFLSSETSTSLASLFLFLSLRGQPPNPSYFPIVVASVPPQTEHHFNISGLYPMHACNSSISVVTHVYHLFFISLILCCKNISSKHLDCITIPKSKSLLVTHCL